MIKVNARGHQFGFDSPHFLRYRDPEGREITFPYQKGLKVRVSPWTGNIKLRFGRDATSLSPLDSDQLKEFLKEFFRQWKKADPESGSKGAFDYVDGQQGFTKVAFVVSIVMGLPMAVALLGDSHQQLFCTRELRKQAVPETVQVVKYTKKDSRTFDLRLEFTPPGGEKIKGWERVVLEKDVYPEKTYPILYSPEHPQCWSFKKAGEAQEVDWPKRRYFAVLALLFGIFFLAASVLGLSWCVAKWMNPRPFTKEVEEAADLHL